MGITAVLITVGGLLIAIKLLFAKFTLIAGKALCILVKPFVIPDYWKEEAGSYRGGGLCDASNVILVGSEMVVEIFF